jgi:ubiquitin C-terminal hydrolase
VDAQKRVLLAQPAPQVLVLHINRTAWHASGVHKVQTHVSFPLKLDNLEQYCAAAAPEPSPASSPGGPSLKAPSKRKQEAEEAKEEAMAYSSSSSSSSSLLEYQLVSVVCHHGHQMGGGHFTAYGQCLESAIRTSALFSCSKSNLIVLRA